MSITSILNVYLSNRKLQIDLIVRLILSALLCLAGLWFHYLNDIYPAWVTDNNGGINAVYAIVSASKATSILPFIIAALLLFTKARYRLLAVIVTVFIFIANIGNTYMTTDVVVEQNYAYIDTEARSVFPVEFHPTRAAKDTVQSLKELPGILEKAVLMTQEMNIGIAKALGITAERKSYEEIKEQIDRNEGVERARKITDQTGIPYTHDD